MHPQVLREIANVIMRPLLINFGQSWQLGEMPKDCQKANATCIFKKCKEEYPGNYRLISLTSTSGKDRAMSFQWCPEVMGTNCNTDGFKHHKTFLYCRGGWALAHNWRYSKSNLDSGWPSLCRSSPAQGTSSPTEVPSKLNNFPILWNNPES